MLQAGQFVLPRFYHVLGYSSTPVVNALIYKDIDKLFPGLDLRFSVPWKGLARSCLLELSASRILSPIHVKIELALVLI